MNAFDLVFIGCALLTACDLTWISFLAIRRHHGLVKARLRRLALVVGVYFAIVVVVGLFSTRRTLAAEGILRYDDWCVGVEAVKAAQQIGQAQAPAGREFVVVTLRIMSEARRGRQAAPRGSRVYLLDANDRRYDVSTLGQAAFEQGSGSQPDLTAKVDPRSSFLTVRVFEVPDDARRLSLAHQHGGRFPGLFIIGDGFCEPPVILLPPPTRLASTESPPKTSSR